MFPRPPGHNGWSKSSAAIKGGSFLFPLQAGSDCGRLRGVRSAVLLVCGLTTFASLLQAQEQDGRLVDRLLHPDLALANPQQNKKFVIANGTSVGRKFEANSYAASTHRQTKAFPGITNFFARFFRTKKFSPGRTNISPATSAPPAYAENVVRTKQSSLVNEAPEATKTATTRDYSDNRPFLGRGTRQKVLSQQDHPLTIEEVRELLNRDRSPNDSP